MLLRRNCGKRNQNIRKIARTTKIFTAWSFPQSYVLVKNKKKRSRLLRNRVKSMTSLVGDREAIDMNLIPFTTGFSSVQPWPKEKESVFGMRHHRKHFHVGICSKNSVITNSTTKLLWITSLAYIWINSWHTPTGSSFGWVARNRTPMCLSLATIWSIERETRDAYEKPFLKFAGKERD